jgi:hypothetical protein
MKASILLLAATALPSCCLFQSVQPPATQYVVADVHFRDLAAERFKSYVVADNTLAPDEQEALVLATDAWVLMVDKAEESLPPGAVTHE